MRTQLPFIAGATALIAATYGLARFGYGLFVPAFSRSFDLTPAVTGTISSGSFVAYCVAAAAAYRMARAPRRTVFLAGAVASAGSIGVALSGSAMILATSMLIAGAGAGFASPGLVTLVEERISSPDAARAQAVVNSGTGFGLVIAGPLALILTDQWRTAWWIIAAINVAATVAVLTTGKLSTARTRTGGCASFRLADLKPLRPAAMAALLAGASSAAVWTFSRALVTTEGRLSESEATLFWVCLGAAGIAGAFSGDLVTRWGLRTGWITTTTLMGSATLALGAWPASNLAVYGGGAVFGAGYVALSGVLIVWAARILPDHSAAGTAALFISLALGQALGSLLIGALLELTDPLLAYAIAAVIASTSIAPALRGTSGVAAVSAARAA
ncbi:MFS transporter [Arthrobacter sp. Br18]|uniref:MFS transporter n=1 Tax=Arthrobacter sp. Br18 TaxID=1312954 RepID=UPI0004B43E88|nr:MFS transporter [Arthrobacter sp. Br18]